MTRSGQDLQITVDRNQFKEMTFTTPLTAFDNSELFRLINDLLSGRVEIASPDAIEKSKEKLLTGTWTTIRLLRGSDNSEITHAKILERLRPLYEWTSKRLAEVKANP